jgi:ketosteroid isomerase-like protein
MLPVLLVLLAPTRFIAQSTAQPDPERDRILSLENAWNQAVRQKDAVALRLLVAPDLIFVDWDGTLMNKVEYLASVESAGLHPAHIVIQSMSVHHYSSVAVVNGVSRESGMNKGKAYLLLERFTDTWVRRGDSWLCVASQSTVMGQ